MRSRCVNGAWSKATLAPFAVPGVQEGDPGITPDGQRLYFISMRHDPAQEDFDIWYVERAGADAWSEPRRLPEPVNSPGAELLPRADRDGHLYFGSDRAGGFGQGDIYVASQRLDGRWTVSNVGPPVSTAANEYEAEDLAGWPHAGRCRRPRRSVPPLQIRARGRPLGRARSYSRARERVPGWPALVTRRASACCSRRRTARAPASCS